MKKKVLVFGTFDKLHKGHLNFLRQARRHGDYLIVVVTRDENVRKQKGHMPMEKCATRAIKVRKFADKVMVGEKKVTYKIIRKIGPDVICIGYDQKPSLKEAKKILRRIGMSKVLLRKMKPYKPNIYKSNKLNKLR